MKSGRRDLGGGPVQSAVNNHGGLIAGLNAVVTGQIRPRPPAPAGRQSIMHFDDDVGSRRGSASSCQSRSSIVGGGARGTLAASLQRVSTMHTQPMGLSRVVAGSSSALPIDMLRTHTEMTQNAGMVDMHKLSSRVDKLEVTLSQMGTQLDSVENSLQAVLKELRGGT